jgi:transketolase
VNGSGLSSAVGAFEAFLQEGVVARVVSPASWNLFEKQDRSYQDSVPPSVVSASTAIEQGVPVGLDRYVGPLGAVMGLHGFGASAPLQDIAVEFGFAIAEVVSAARRQISRRAREPDSSRSHMAPDGGRTPRLGIPVRFHLGSPE